jgi:aminopeptidase N
MLRRVFLVLIVVWLTAGAVGTAVYAQEPQSGADGIGDPLFPSLGNGGYDALHYTLDLSADIQSDTLSGTVTMEAQATQALSAFNLDFWGFSISAITVNDEPANYHRRGSELTIVPAAPLAEGDRFTVSITYSGVPQGVDAVNLPLLTGWTDYGTGAFVASEPAGAEAWYPVNDHPLDKATYTFRITVADPYVVAANGVLTQTIDHGDTSTYVWEMRQPMASYLATVDIDRFVLKTSAGPDGLPIRNYFPSDVADSAVQTFGATADMIAFFDDIFGPYPFDAYGVVVANTRLPFALETQTLTLFGRNEVGASSRGELVVVHELSHQWFGDSVSLADWKDIWLNEGFATYASWLWFEHTQGSQILDSIVRQNYESIASDTRQFSITISKQQLLNVLSQLSLDQASVSPDAAAQVVHMLVDDPALEDQVKASVAGQPGGEITGQEILTFVDSLPFNQVALKGGEIHTLITLLGLEHLLKEGAQFPESHYVPPGDPTAADLFNAGVYQRGALTLHGLRLQIADTAFFKTLRTYYDRYQYGNATTADFIAVAEEVSGQDLGDFFDAWLHDPIMPDIPEMGLSVG